MRRPLRLTFTLCVVGVFSALGQPALAPAPAPALAPAPAPAPAPALAPAPAPAPTSQLSPSPSPSPATPPPLLYSPSPSPSSPPPFLSSPHPPPPPHSPPLDVLPPPSAVVSSQYLAAPQECYNAIASDIVRGGSVVALSQRTCATCASHGFCVIGINEYTGELAGWATPSPLQCLGGANTSIHQIVRTDYEGVTVTFCVETRKTPLPLILAPIGIFVFACCAPCLFRRRVRRGAVPAAAAAGAPPSHAVLTEEELDEETALGWCTMRAQAPKERASGLPSYNMDEEVTSVEEKARIVYEFEQGYVVYSHPHLEFEPDSGSYVGLIPYLFKLNIAIFWASLELVQQAYAYFHSAPNAAEAAEAATVAAHKAAAAAGADAAAAGGEDAAVPHLKSRLSVESLEQFAHTFHISNRPLASFLADLWFYFKNNHDLLCVVYVHPLYPQKRHVKILTLVCELFFTYFVNWQFTHVFNPAPCDALDCDPQINGAEFAYGHAATTTAPSITAVILVSLCAAALKYPFRCVGESCCLNCFLCFCHDRSKFKRQARAVGFWLWTVCGLPGAVALFIFAVMGTTNPRATAVGFAWSTLLAYFGTSNAAIFVGFAKLYRSEVIESKKVHTDNSGCFSCGASKNVDAAKKPDALKAPDAVVVARASVTKSSAVVHPL